MLQGFNKQAKCMRRSKENQYYFCSLSHSTGEPKIIVSPSSPLSVTAGSSVTLECAAAGDPPPAVQWITRNQSRSNLQLIESGRGVLKLMIEDTRSEDQGNYTCQARNLVGVTRESIQLIGKQPAIILRFD